MKRKWGSPWKTSEQTYGLMTRCAAHRYTIDVRPRARMYGDETLFHQSSHSSYFIVIELFFSRNRTNDGSFHNNRGYGASKELHGGALQLRWVQTHMDALFLLFMHYISILYISNMHILQLSWNTFPIDGHYRTNFISGVGHPKSDLVVPLVLRMVCCAMAGALALYYRSLGTMSTLLRMSNISSRPYCWTMTVTLYHMHILHIYLYHLHDKLSSHNVACVL